MATSIDRRGFLKRAGTAAVTFAAAPLVVRHAAAASDRLVVAVGQWGTETPFAWRHVQAEKPLWDCHDVMLGMKSITWAVSRKVGAWSTLAYVPAETNYEYVTPAS